MRINFSKSSVVILALLLLSSHSVADDNTWLVVESAMPRSYDLASVKDITFSNEGISVNMVNGESLPFTYSSFSELRFSLSMPTAVEGVPTAIMSGRSGVYDLQGRKVATLQNGESLSSLPLSKGIYIVRSGNKSVKVIKR